MTNRRSFLFGAAAVAAPAIVPFGSLMPVRGIIMPVNLSTADDGWIINYIVLASGEFFTIDRDQNVWHLR